MSEDQGGGMHPTSGTCHTSGPPSSNTRATARPGRDEEEGHRGRMARGGGEVTTVIANLTVGPDGCGGLAIYVRSGGAS